VSLCISITWGRHLTKVSAGWWVCSDADACFHCPLQVSSISSKLTNRSPAPPFITSTLQQEANRWATRRTRAYCCHTRV
jgi:hypothetical protein